MTARPVHHSRRRPDPDPAPSPRGAAAPRAGSRAARAAAGRRRARRARRSTAARRRAHRARGRAGRSRRCCSSAGGGAISRRASRHPRAALARQGRRRARRPRRPARRAGDARSPAPTSCWRTSSRSASGSLRGAAGERRGSDRASSSPARPRPRRRTCSLVHTIDPERAVILQTKYYRDSISNLVKIRRDEDFTQVGGRWRPARSAVETLPPAPRTHAPHARAGARRPTRRPRSSRPPGLRAPSPITWP